MRRKIQLHPAGIETCIKDCKLMVWLKKKKKKVIQLKTARIKRGIHIHASVNVVAAVYSQVR